MPPHDRRDFAPYQLLRVALTPALLCASHLRPKEMLLALAAILLVLDVVDCRLGDALNRHVFVGRPALNPCSTSAAYRAVDKLTDQMQYAAALCLLWTAPGVPPSLKWALLAAWLWRMIGVAFYVASLVAFPDLFKEFLVLWAACSSPSFALALTPIVFAGKAAFERIKGSIDEEDRRKYEKEEEEEEEGHW